MLCWGFHKEYGVREEGMRHMTQDIDIAKICELANIKLTAEEQAAFQESLGAIVGYVQKIAEVDVSGIEPTVHGRLVTNVFRDDTQEQSLDREIFLMNAPQRVDNEFKVPRIVE